MTTALSLPGRLTVWHFVQLVCLCVGEILSTEEVLRSAALYRSVNLLFWHNIKHSSTHQISIISNMWGSHSPLHLHADSREVICLPSVTRNCVMACIRSFDSNVLYLFLVHFQVSLIIFNKIIYKKTLLNYRIFFFFLLHVKYSLPTS